MITCVTYDNLDITGRAFCSQFELRHKCFIERQTYNVKSYNKKEYDQYDTPAAVYLVYQASDGTALGASRLTPTSHCCMLNDLWPDMAEQKQMLCSENIWEGTRFCIDKDLPPFLRKRIIHELVLSYIEFGLQVGVKKIIGVMPKLIFRSVFKASGVIFDPLGPSRLVDDVQIQASTMNIDHEQLTRVRKTTGISHSVLQTYPKDNQQLQVA